MKTIVYFHGYGSSCRSNSATCLAKNLPEYNVIAPDIPVDPKEALPFLKSYCAKNKVDLIIGTSMGGMYAMQMADYRHISYPDLSYHGREPWTVWLSDDRKSIGMLYCGAYGEPGRKDADDVMVLYNFYFEDETFQLPKARKGRGNTWGIE